MKRNLFLLLLVIFLSFLSIPSINADTKNEIKGLFGLPKISQMDFNRIAAQAGMPLFWVEDKNNNTIIDPDELVLLGSNEKSEKWVNKGKFTMGFESAYKRIIELKREEVVKEELNQGIPTLVFTDFSKADAKEKEFVKQMLKIGKMVEDLHMKQRGSLALTSKLNKVDSASRALFNRNQGPWCFAPKTEKDIFCNALPDFQKEIWDTYPSDEQNEEGFCNKLNSQPNAKELLNPFTVVRIEKDRYIAIPYIKVYGKEMRAIASEIRKAIKFLDPKTESALISYLEADAKAFETGNWEEADEAWSRMNATNSRWYLRLAADEVYWDLCQQKAGFHMSFALIDKSSLRLQERLEPLRDEMESLLEKLSENTYRARKVSFAMPDFIEIIANFGDARSPLGATIGQSLPNWGKVAEEGRGRTVVMTNLYQDAQSKKMAKEKASTLLTDETLKYYTDDRMLSLIDIVLHEATHNLGPHSDYKINGKGPSEIFGGGVASTLEELKAQTGSLYYTDLLRKKGIVSDEDAKKIYTNAIVWAFGHISQGMFTSSGNPKNYSQLAAVQIGFLMEEGALEWKMVNDSTTGKTIGKFNIVYEKMPAAVEKLMAKVVKIKATGDVDSAKSLIEPYVSGSKRDMVHHEEISERLLRFPRASMVYSVKL
ncbi:MAG: hypothetical protein ACP5QK_12755 [Myxococcota bacterium]